MWKAYDKVLITEDDQDDVESFHEDDEPEVSVLTLYLKCKRVIFHSFKELHEGQHVFE